MSLFVNLNIEKYGFNIRQIPFKKLTFLKGEITPTEMPIFFKNLYYLYVLVIFT